jgi:membrane protease YdiL (CAAX protease family)
MTDSATLPYHRLSLAWPKARWWRPLVGLLISVGLYAGVMLIGGVGLAISTLLSSGLAGIESVSAVLDQYRPADFVLTMGSIVLMLPAALIGFRLAGCRPIGLLSSTAGRLRWRWMLWCCGPAAVILALVLGIDVALQAIAGEVRTAPVGTPWLFLLILLLTPFQAAAEEYAFRGVLMQTIGAWLRSPAWAILLPIPLFVLGHVYSIPGQVSVGVFAAAAGWITWRTGGLEAAIALHVINNLAALLFGAAGFSDLNATEVGWLGAAISSAVPIVFVLWVDRVYRRRAAQEASVASSISSEISSG